MAIQLDFLNLNEYTVRKEVSGTNVNYLFYRGLELVIRVIITRSACVDDDDKVFGFEILQYLKLFADDQSWTITVNVLRHFVEKRNGTLYYYPLRGGTL